MVASAAGPAVLSHVQILTTCRILGARVSLAGVSQNGGRRVCAVGHTLQPGQVLFRLKQRQSSHHAVNYPLRFVVGVAVLLPAHARAGLQMHTRYHHELDTLAHNCAESIVGLLSSRSCVMEV